MSQNLIPFESAGLPAHIAEKFGQTNTDLASGIGGGGFPSISYKGKVWHVIDGDQKTLVTKPGEDDPASSLEVVILKANPHLSKVYYKGGYVEGSEEKPTCYSNNGVGPALDAQEPQAAKCAVCPHNAWGSRVSENGAKGKACSDSRRLAVAPAGELDYPMLLRVPAGTLKELAGYADMLNRRKAPYQAVVTKVSFDHSVAHQKFLFKAVRWLSEDEAEQVAATLEKDVIQKIIGLTPVEEPEDELGSAPAHVAKLAPPPASKAKAKLQATEEEVEAAMAAPEPAPATPPKTAAKPKAKAAEPAPAPAKNAAAKALLDEANASLDDVLAALDD